MDERKKWYVYIFQANRSSPSAIDPKILGTITFDFGSNKKNELYKMDTLLHIISKL